MKLIWHMFQKDARRHWWEVSISLSLLAWLTHLDAARSDATSSSMEGWLNVLLPTAWSYLVALLIVEDTPVGDRQFWVTVPCHWAKVVVAKLIFLAIFIHLPYLLAIAAIVTGRGFAPLPYALLLKQLGLLLTLTAPALGVAVLVRSVTQYNMLLLVVVSAVVWITSGITPALPTLGGNLLLSLMCVVLSGGAIVTVLLQYSGRRLILARSVGGFTAIAAVVIWGWLPSDVFAAAQCALSSGKGASGTISIGLSRADKPIEAVVRNYLNWGGGVAVATPVEMSGRSAGVAIRFVQIAFAIRDEEGATDDMRWPGAFESRAFQPRTMPRLLAQLLPHDKPEWQALQMDRALYARLQHKPVSFKGRVLASSFQHGPSTSFPVGSRRSVPGVGTCASSAVTGWRLGDDLIRVDCESPSPFSGAIIVKLIDPTTRQEWNTQIGGSSIAFMPHLRWTWLSPMHRGSAFFHVSAEDRSSREASQWIVPREVAARVEVVITPQPNTGCSVIDYELRNVLLREWALPVAARMGH